MDFFDFDWIGRPRSTGNDRSELHQVRFPNVHCEEICAGGRLAIDGWGNRHLGQGTHAAQECQPTAHQPGQLFSVALSDVAAAVVEFLSGLVGKGDFQSKSKNCFQIGNNNIDSRQQRVFHVANESLDPRLLTDLTCFYLPISVMQASLRSQPPHPITLESLDQATGRMVTEEQPRYLSRLGGSVRAAGEEVLLSGIILVALVHAYG
ncbi:hypothetical protein [Rhizobium laguerreae]|uniref:hypothetical protein n=1 Tax=Rhizobium laguerreae TaxID=1076926 RepID=UPI001C8FE231|nr:hypothetical protein [Rhizobium laguerreae]MBY3124530.1 hypothetical protein [Rhizobium laguerreae]